MLQPLSCLFRESSRLWRKKSCLCDGPQPRRLEGASSPGGEGTEEDEAQKGTLGMGAGGQAGTPRKDRGAGGQTGVPGGRAEVSILACRLYGWELGQGLELRGRGL